MPTDCNRRLFILGGLVTAHGITSAVAEPSFFDAVIGDAKNAQGRRYGSIQQAIDQAPDATTRPYRIFIGRGQWTERLTVNKPLIHLFGENRADTVITYGLAAGMAGGDGNPVGTWGCASVVIRAPGFRAQDLTIENSFDYIAHLAAPRFERIGPNGAQAVACMLTDLSDDAQFERVTFIGHQDTLFTDTGRGLFADCAIFGSVDFIFGAGTAFFDKCRIISRFRPGQQRNNGYLTAPATPRNAQFGFVFRNCRLEREPQVPDGGVVLGRPWRPSRMFANGRYGDPDAVGSSYFLDCWMDGHISADGWDEMGYTDQDGQRKFLQPSDARFGEYGSAGPGAFRNPRRPQLPMVRARAISIHSVLGLRH